MWGVLSVSGGKSRVYGSASAVSVRRVWMHWGRAGTVGAAEAEEAAEELWCLGFRDKMSWLVLGFRV